MELTMQGVGFFAALFAIPLIVWRKRLGRALAWIMELPYTGVVLTVTVLTIILFLSINLVLGGMLFMFWPFLFLAAVIIGAIARSKAYWVALLTFIAVLVLLVPLSLMLDHLPAWEVDRFRVVLQVDTPEGLKEGSREYAVMSNRVNFGNARGGGYRLKGEDQVLDLGGGNRLRAVIPMKTNCCRHYLQEVFGYYDYEKGKTEGRKELIGVNSPALVASSHKETRSIPKSGLESFFGPGYHFRRMWLEVLD
jgi:energy-coupling factor transporter transmembrane protein EcfT